MGNRSGGYSGNIFKEWKRYVAGLAQSVGRRPLIDRDVNDVLESAFHQLQRAIGVAFGKQFVGDSFKVIGLGIANNFSLNGNGASLLLPDSWARGWVNGHQVLLTVDPSPYVPSSPTVQTKDELYHRSTGLTALTLQDSSMKWVVNELVGRTLYPNVDSVTGFTIISNTANTITIGAGDMTTVAAVGDNYYIGLTTPTVDRDDLVYLDVFVDEWDATEDPDLLHPIATGVESWRRLKVVQALCVSEGITSVSDYVDSDGNQHYVVKLAYLHRLAANPNITSGMVEDLRDAWYGSGPEVVEARGVMRSLEERIFRTYDPITQLPVTDGVINPDGTLNPDAVNLTINHDDLADMPDIAPTPATANSDHDKRYGGLDYSLGPIAQSSGVSIVSDNESHRDAISRLNHATLRAAQSVILMWANA
jgi:hypothetical protein